jgi:hypothetical protein
VFARFRDAAATVRGNTNVLTLALPPGRFLVLGKASVRQDAGQSMTCQLRDSLGNFDETDLRAFGQATRGSFTLTVIRSSSSSETVFLVCMGPDRFGSTVDGTLRDMKLTAIEIGEFSNLPG